MRIGLVDVDGHNFPNFALMRISGYHKGIGDDVEWADPIMGNYDRVYMSKIFTFTPDYPYEFDCEVIKGGTGYDIKSRLPKEIEDSTAMDYSIYPDCNFSIQFFSRGCIRKCPFCLVSDKEGHIHRVKPVELNPNGEWIEVLDNNFFANPYWKNAIKYLIKANRPVKFHGVDVRIMTEEQVSWLNKVKLKGRIHIAWDNPSLDLTDKLEEVTKYIKPYKLMCYVLIGFNSTIEQDLYRVETLRKFGIDPFVQPYRDFANKRVPTQYEKDFARWANNKIVYRKCKFEDFEPRKGFLCREYLKK
jgi:radical SAM superfamily enzyme YgiQ (UPF0313 family)